MKIRVKVTKNDIRYGHKREYNSCPVQRAISRMRVDDKTEVWAGAWSWGMERSDESSSIATGPLPKKAQDWIYDYDNDKKVEPIEFDLNIPKALAPYIKQ